MKMYIKYEYINNNNCFIYFQRITLCDEDDPTFLCKINVTRCDYEDLKKQQGLLIDFDNFPSQVVRLLQQCATNNMYGGKIYSRDIHFYLLPFVTSPDNIINLFRFLFIHQKTPIEYNFEVVEHNEFRRLIHLSLKTGPASDNEIKQHMAETIKELKVFLQYSYNYFYTIWIYLLHMERYLPNKLRTLKYTEVVKL